MMQYTDRSIELSALCGDSKQKVKGRNAPAKIYLQRGDDLKARDGHWEGETWCADKINARDVEYIRADLVKARVERARNQLPPWMKKIQKERSAK